MQSASLLLWIQELRERDLPVLTQPSQGIALRSEPRIGQLWT